MVTIPSLVEITQPATTDLVAIETGAGTRGVQRNNFLPRRFDIDDLTIGNLNTATDSLAMWDATDGLLKRTDMSNVLFGQFNNQDALNGFTLDPAQFGVNPIECRGTFVIAEIALDGNTSGIGGSNFVIANYTTDDLTVIIANIILFFEGASVPSATIRQNTLASINVRNDASEAIFSGG